MGTEIIEEHAITEIVCHSSDFAASNDEVQRQKTSLVKAQAACDVLYRVPRLISPPYAEKREMLRESVVYNRA